jgi:hypothetical protein
LTARQYDLEPPETRIPPPVESGLTGHKVSFLARPRGEWCARRHSGSIETRRKRKSLGRRATRPFPPVLLDGGKTMHVPGRPGAPPSGRPGRGLLSSHPACGGRARNVRLRAAALRLHIVDREATGGAQALQMDLPLPAFLRDCAAGSPGCGPPVNRDRYSGVE